MEETELLRYNEWWDKGRVKAGNLAEYKRYLFPEIQRFEKERQIILVTGLRRVGKSRLMYQIIQSCIDRKIPVRNILYFSFDEGNYDIKDVMEIYQSVILRKDFDDIDRVYIFFDEIQKVDDWQNKIKTYYDLNPNIKFYLTGSASLILSKKAKESLAGRIYEFTLKPFTFKEFLGLKGVDITYKDTRLFNKKILIHFSDFLRKAGFPEISDEDDDEKIRSYVRLSVAERVLYRDIPKEFGRVDIELLEILMNMFFQNPGMILNMDNLVRDLRKDKKTLMNYVYYFRFALLVNLVSNYRLSISATSRKNKKVYPATTSLIFSVLGRFDGSILGKALETLFCSERGAMHYFRKGGSEIDFLLLRNKVTIPSEIKATPSAGDFKKFSSIMKRQGLKKGLMLSYKTFDTVSEKGVKILVYPMWVFLVFPDEVLKELR